MKLINKTRNSVLAESVECANTFAARSKGLLGRKDFPAGSALVIQPCNSIHTFFMQFPIDVLFVHKDGKILSIFQGLPPGKLSPVVWRAAYVVELSAGALAHAQVSVGDFVEIVQ